MENLNSAAKDLIAQVTAHYQEKLAWQSQPKIHSAETISFVAFAYEKLRNFVDYQEEHLLRRRAIARALSRRLLSSSPSTEMAKALIMELIRSRYLPNNTLPEEKIIEVTESLVKFHKLIANFAEKKEIWVSFAAREIEENLTLDNELNLVIFTYRFFKEKLLVKEDLLLFIAVEEALSRADEETIRYHLLKLKVNDWTNLQDLKKINEEISGIFLMPEKDLLVRKLRKRIAPFVILRDLIIQNEANLSEIFTEPEKLEKTVTTVANWRYRKASQSSQTAAIQSFIYIFLTKMVFAFLIEAPYDLYVVGHVKLLPITVNLLFPPFFMLVTTQTVSSPGTRNTRLILAELKKAIYPQNEASLPEITFDLSVSARPTLNALFNLFYLLTFVIVFGGVIYILRSLGFSFVSMAVFFFFVSTVAFFAFRIRRNFQDLKIAAENENLGIGLFNFISYPFIRLGRVFSSALSHINIFVFILDILIEAPLKTLLELIEEWFAFIRRKQEEILQ